MAKTMLAVVGYVALELGVTVRQITMPVAAQMSSTVSRLLRIWQQSCRGVTTTDATGSLPLTPTSSHGLVSPPAEWQTLEPVCMPSTHFVHP
jgi:hypothetical protein